MFLFIFIIEKFNVYNLRTVQPLMHKKTVIFWGKIGLSFAERADLWSVHLFKNLWYIYTDFFKRSKHLNI